MGTMILRADKVFMEGTDAGDGGTLKAGSLYSDFSYVEDNLWRTVIAHARSNCVRMSSVELEATSYEEADCQTNRCHTYRRQKLLSYSSVLFPYGVVLSTSHRAERRIPGKTTKMSIESKLVSAETLFRMPHLEFRQRIGMYIAEYMSKRDFYVLV